MIYSDIFSYGEIGLAIIVETLDTEFPREEPHFVAFAGRYPWQSCMMRVLVPEMAIRLIQDETSVHTDYNSARQTLVESAKYGRMRFAADGTIDVDDDLDKRARIRARMYALKEQNCVHHDR